MTVSLANYLATETNATSQLSSSSSTATSGASGSSGSSITSGQTSLNSSYQTFLTLLTTQLKNQDPTSPMDPNQFTTELVQMNGVQQQLLSNQLLQTLVNNSPSSNVSSAVDLIGQKVTATSSAATLSGGQASWTYTLPETAAKATLTISNSSGQTVWTGTPPNFAQGTSSFTWNGQDSSGAQEPNGGSYTLAITASDVNGSAMTPTISVQGTATSVQSTNGVTMVNIGGSSVPVSAITNVGGS